MPKSLTIKELVERARIKHSGKYIYDKTDINHKDNKGRVCITCPIHGDFWQRPSSHLSGKGCKKCKGLGLNNEEKISKAISIHRDLYDFSKSDFANVKKKTTVTCMLHGDFNIDYDHLVNSKQGCPICGGTKKLTVDEFEKIANAIHNRKYTYHQDYVNMHSNVLVSCQIHGDFYKNAQAHIKGQGCPICSAKSKLEETLNKRLSESGIEYESQKRFCWLGLQSLDFYIHKCRIAIECQGSQHFGIGGWSKEFDFGKQKERDNRKYKLCIDNNVRILYFAKYKPADGYIDEIYTDADEIIEIIKKIY